MLERLEDEEVENHECARINDNATKYRRERIGHVVANHSGAKDDLALLIEEIQGEKDKGEYDPEFYRDLQPYLDFEL